MPPAWKDYQEATATYYRELGLSAETDASIDGVRGKHSVDVAVRGYRAGVEFLWIVECKFWDRPVPKATVATLSAIVLDVGADRGIILSRKGFQSGAPAMARRSNMTLTSLEKLKEGTKGEYYDRQCDRICQRCDSILTALHSNQLEKLRNPDDNPLDWPDIVIGARAGALKTATTEALAGRWPVSITHAKDGLEGYAFPDNMTNFLAICDVVLSDLENQLAAAVAKLLKREEAVE